MGIFNQKIGHRSHPVFLTGNFKTKPNANEEIMFFEEKEMFDFCHSSNC